MGKAQRDSSEAESTIFVATPTREKGDKSLLLAENRKVQAATIVKLPSEAN